MGRHLNDTAPLDSTTSQAQFIDRLLSTCDLPLGTLNAWDLSVEITKVDCAADLWSLPENTTPLPLSLPPPPLPEITIPRTDAAASTNGHAVSAASTNHLLDTCLDTVGKAGHADSSGYERASNAVANHDDVQDVAADASRLPTRTPSDTHPRDWTDQADQADILTKPTVRSAQPSRRAVRPSALVTVLVVVGSSAAAGLATVLLTAQLTRETSLDRPPSVGHKGTSVPDLDGRVMVPGQTAGCPTMLVKPRPDGSTADVGGTCFAVG